MGIEIKAKRALKNQWRDKEVCLYLDYSSSTSCAITDCKWLSEGGNLWLHWTGIIFLSRVYMRIFICTPEGYHFVFLYIVSLKVSILWMPIFRTAYFFHVISWYLPIVLSTLYIFLKYCSTSEILIHRDWYPASVLQGHF